MHDRRLKARGKPMVSKTISKRFDSFIMCHGLVAQLVERLPEEQEVGGSIPSESIFGPLAQLVRADGS